MDVQGVIIKFHFVDGKLDNPWFSAWTSNILERSGQSTKECNYEFPYILQWKYAHWENSVRTNLFALMNLSLYMHSKFVYHPGDSCNPKQQNSRMHSASQTTVIPSPTLGVLPSRVPGAAFLLKGTALDSRADMYCLCTFQHTLPPTYV